MTVLITLTSAGADTGPFNLYSNVDGYITPFETGISKAALLAGYSSILVPDGTATVRIKSTGSCVNSTDVTVVYPTTTTTTTIGTTTTTTTASPTQDILLGYDGASDTASCVNIATPVTRYIPTGQDWLVVTYLYQDAAGTTPAISGYYSDGAKWYYWDETTETFTSTGFC